MTLSNILLLQNNVGQFISRHTSNDVIDNGSTVSTISHAVLCCLIYVMYVLQRCLAWSLIFLFEGTKLARDIGTLLCPKLRHWPKNDPKLPKPVWFSEERMTICVASTTELFIITVCDGHCYGLNCSVNMEDIRVSRSYPHTTIVQDNCKLHIKMPLYVGSIYVIYGHRMLYMYRMTNCIFILFHFAG